MKTPSFGFHWRFVWTALFAVLAFVATSRAQVTFQQITNGLVIYYPLDFVWTNGSTLKTIDFVGERDMVLFQMNGTNVIPSTRPSGSSTSVSNCFNFDQQGGVGATLIYYITGGQNPLTGGGDFLPFCNQINATMSFWIKANASSGYPDSRFFGEADGYGPRTSPLWLFGTDTSGLSANKRAHFLFQQQTGGLGSAPTLHLSDGSFEAPNFAGYWTQGSNYTAGNLLDGSWHQFTMTVDSNRVMDIYIDGVRDAGPPGPVFTDKYGNPTYGPAIPLTNVFYTTNIYPSAGVSNPPPNGYVRWVWNSIFQTGATSFGGYHHNNGNAAGFPMLMDDIGFWNRKLSTNEISYLVTNGICATCFRERLPVINFTADFNEVGPGDTVTLRWTVDWTTNISISGLGNVSALGPIAATNIIVNGTTNIILTASNSAGIATASVSILVLPGVSADWHLIQRFDGLFSDTTEGINGYGWSYAFADFSGMFDRWNVITITNSGRLNKALAPRTGYLPNVMSPTGYESRGAFSPLQLNSLTMAPGQSNTVFFRFSLQSPLWASDGVNNYYSDMDFYVGLTDLNSGYPFYGLGYYAGTGGGLGPYFSIIRDSGSNFDGQPFNLFAPDRDEATGNTTNTFNYTALHPNGLETNKNYLVWMDIWNRDTHAEFNPNTGETNTVNEAQYSVWLQKQGEPTRTLLFSGFHGNRDYVHFNQVSDSPTPYLNKFFVSIGSESFVSFMPGSYFGTNMIAVDDIYFSKSGFKSSIPKLLELSSIIRNPSDVTIAWHSLGSLFQTNTYTVQRKFDLTDSGWTTLTNVPSGGDSTTYVDTTVGASSSAFYRVLWP